jgi:hypothetical protein
MLKARYAFVLMVLAVVLVATLTHSATASTRTVLVRLKVTSPIAEDEAGAIGELVKFTPKANGNTILVFEVPAF